MSKLYSVYCLETIDGRRYIGTTSLPLEERWNHGNGYRAFPELWNMIVKHGWDRVTKTVLSSGLSVDEASKMEQEFIMAYDTTDPTKGYNSELGGVGSRKIVSDRIRKKQSEQKTGFKNPNFGKHFSESHKRKLSESNTGKRRSDETRERVGLAKQKPVNQYTTSGVLIGTWNSGKEAAKATGTQAGHISKVCKHQRSTAGGFVWAYAD